MFTAKESTKEVAWPKAVPPLLWWRPQAATVVLAFNKEDLWQSTQDLSCMSVRLDDGLSVGRTLDCMDGMFLSLAVEALPPEQGAWTAFPGAE